MKLKHLIFAALGIVVLCLGSCGWIMSQVEHPQYTVIQKTGNIETRKYAPRIVAEVTTYGPRKEALTEGFRVLADYIFGNNLPAKNISMTSPVTQQQEQGQKIAMTAPVEQKPQNEGWVTQFTMPAEWTLATLPQPSSDSIQLIEVPAKKVIAIEFSGINSEDNIQKYLKLLEAHILENSVEVNGDPVYAFYNPPWTLPFLRRNEVIFELK